MNVPSSMPNPKSSRWGGGVIDDEMREMQWVKPELVAQIRFVEWTAEGGCGLRRSSGCGPTRARERCGGKRTTVSRGPVQFGQTEALLSQVKSSDDAWCVPDGRTPRALLNRHRNVRHPHDFGSFTSNLMAASCSGALPILRRNGSHRASCRMLANMGSELTSTSPGSR